MAKLIVIHGLKYSGKSTTATPLMNEYDFIRVKMSDPLKNMLRSLMRDVNISNEMIERYIEGDLKEEPIPQLDNVTSRRLMETLGEDWRNLHGRDFWVNIAASRISKHLNDGFNVVVDDIRYLFELQGFSKFSPAAWVVTKGSKHFEPYGEDRHPGERPLPVNIFHEHIENNGTIEDLWAKIRNLVLKEDDKLINWAA